MSRERKPTHDALTEGPDLGPTSISALQLRNDLAGQPYQVQLQRLQPVRPIGWQPVQRRSGGAEPGTAAVRHTAAEGVKGAGRPLPFLDKIQASMPGHDLGDVQAHIGGKAAEACSAIGANAYATGNDVAFKKSPDLHTAAHEAAHVVQQRTGVQLSGGVGKAGDVYEKQADRVADAVVGGSQLQPVPGLQLSSATSAQESVQREEPTGGSSSLYGESMPPEFVPVLEVSGPSEPVEVGGTASINVSMVNFDSRPENASFEWQIRVLSLGYQDLSVGTDIDESRFEDLPVTSGAAAGPNVELRLPVLSPGVAVVDTRIESSDDFGLGVYRGPQVRIEVVDPETAGIDDDEVLGSYVDIIFNTYLSEGIRTACSKIGEQDPPSLLAVLVRQAAILGLGNLSTAIIRIVEASPPPSRFEYVSPIPGEATEGRSGNPVATTLIRGVSKFLTSEVSDAFSAYDSVDIDDFRRERINALGDSLIEAHNQVRDDYETATPGEWSAIVSHWRTSRSLRRDLQEAMIDNTLDHWLCASDLAEHGEGGALGAGDVQVGEAADFHLHLELNVEIRGRGDFDVSVDGASIGGLNEELRGRFLERALNEIAAPIDMSVHVEHLRRDDSDDGGIRRFDGGLATEGCHHVMARYGRYAFHLVHGLELVAGYARHSGDEVPEDAADRGAELIWEQIANTRLGDLVDEVGD